MIRLSGLIVLAAIVAGVSGTAWAEPIVFTAHLDGASEEPPNASTGTGFSRVTIDLVAHTLHVQVSFADLLGTTTAAHIHAATAVPGAGTTGVATQLPLFTDFPVGVTGGSYDFTFDTSMASTFNPSYVADNGGDAAGAESALAASMAAGDRVFEHSYDRGPGRRDPRLPPGGPRARQRPYDGHRYPRRARLRPPVDPAGRAVGIGAMTI